MGDALGEGAFGVVYAARAEWSRSEESLKFNWWREETPAPLQVPWVSDGIPVGFPWVLHGPPFGWKGNRKLKPSKLVLILLAVLALLTCWMGERCDGLHGLTGLEVGFPG